MWLCGGGGFSAVSPSAGLRHHTPLLRPIEMKHRKPTARVILSEGRKTAKQHPMWQQDAYRMIQRRARAVIHIYLRDSPIEQFGATFCS